MMLNRTLGLDGVKLSDYLGLEVSKDNMRFINPPPEDLNMHRDIVCQHGKRYRVTSRSLDTLGYVRGWVVSSMSTRGFKR